MAKEPNVAAVGAAHIVAGEHPVSGASGNQFFVEQNELIKVSDRLAQIVVDDQNNVASIGQLAENLKNHRFGFLIDSDKGFIKAKDIGFLGQGTGQKYPLLLPPDSAPMGRS